MTDTKTFPIRVFDQDDNILYQDEIVCWLERAFIMTEPFALELDIQHDPIKGVKYQVFLPTMEELLAKSWKDVDEKNGNWITVTVFPDLNLLPRDKLVMDFPAIVATLS